MKYTIYSNNEKIMPADESIKYIYAGNTLLWERVKKGFTIDNEGRFSRSGILFHTGSNLNYKFYDVNTKENWEIENDGHDYLLRKMIYDEYPLFSSYGTFSEFKNGEFKTIGIQSPASISGWTAFPSDGSIIKDATTSDSSVLRNLFSNMNNAENIIVNGGLNGIHISNKMIASISGSDTPHIIGYIDRNGRYVLDIGYHILFVTDEGNLITADAPFSINRYGEIKAIISERTPAGDIISSTSYKETVYDRYGYRNNYYKIGGFYVLSSTDNWYGASLNNISKKFMLPDSDITYYCHYNGNYYLYWQNSHKIYKSSQLMTDDDVIFAGAENTIFENVRSNPYIDKNGVLYAVVLNNSKYEIYELKL